MSYYNTPESKDPQLWEIARRRASFKGHLITYLLVNGGLWLLWYFTIAQTRTGLLPWPVWSTLGWGIGLLSHYVSAYHATRFESVENEYNKLTQNQSK